MKKIIFVCFIAIAVAGCVPVLLGAGVVTGYAISSDASIGNVKTDYRNLWDVCLKKLAALEAEVVQTDQSRGLIKARIVNHDISITIKNISPDTQRLKVSARKHLLPKPQYAQNIFFKIIEDI